ncbi:MAG: hypothetical protein ABW003_13885 [Microvirga sp.]
MGKSAQVFELKLDHCAGTLGVLVDGLYLIDVIRHVLRRHEEGPAVVTGIVPKPDEFREDEQRSVIRREIS